jgi:hypothetical protein
MEIKDLKDMFNDIAVEKVMADFKEKIETSGKAGFRKEMGRDPHDDDELIRYCFSCYLFNPQSPLSESLGLILNFLSLLIKIQKGEEEYARLGVTVHDGLKILVQTIEESLVLAEVWKAQQDVENEVSKAMDKKLTGGLN